MNAEEMSLTLLLVPVVPRGPEPLSFWVIDLSGL